MGVGLHDNASSITSVNFRRIKKAKQAHYYCILTEETLVAQL